MKFYTFSEYMQKKGIKSRTTIYNMIEQKKLLLKKEGKFSYVADVEEIKQEIKDKQEINEIAKQKFPFNEVQFQALNEEVNFHKAHIQQLQTQNEQLLRQNEKLIEQVKSMEEIKTLLSVMNQEIKQLQTEEKKGFFSKIFKK